MKKAILALAVSASFCFSSTAVERVYSFAGDMLVPENGVETPSVEQIKEHKERSKLVAQSITERVQRILVFYQPSYADKFGVDVIHKRIEKAILTDYQKVAGEGRIIEIVDILPITSVDNAIPYGNRVDLSGDIVTYGNNWVNALLLGLYNILDVPIDDETDEGKEYLKYSPDLVVMFRERRPDEGNMLGEAWVGGVNSVVFDSGTGLTTPEKKNLLSSVVPHEIGHNHVLRHEVVSEEGEIDTSGNYSSNHAAQCGDAVTLMWSTAGDSIENLGFYSSPYKYHKGEACGYEPDSDGKLNGAFNRDYYDYYFDNVHSSLSTSINTPNSEVSFSTSSISVSESDGRFTLFLERNGDISGEAHVYVRVTDQGTAKFPEDVIQYKQKATFEPGETQASVTFDVMQDMLDENYEALELELVYPYNVVTSSKNINVHISDSYISPEERGEVVLKSPTDSVIEGQVGFIEFSRVGGSKGDVLISLRPEYYLFEDTGLDLHEKVVSAKHSATEGRDYIMPSTHVVLRDGETTLRVPVQTLDDLDPETKEGIEISVAPLSGDSIDIEDGNNGALLISDDDAARAGVIAIEADILEVNESDGSLDFTVFRDLDFEGNVPFEITITIKYGNGEPPIVAKLLSSFQEDPNAVIVEDLPEGEDNNTDVDEGKYEAIKYFSHQIRKTQKSYGSYTVEVAITNLIENGLVDSEKSSVVFTVIDDSNPLTSSQPYPVKAEKSGGAMNIVYLLACLAVIGFRRKKK